MYPGHRYNQEQQFRVSPVISNEAFHYALETSALRTNPEYVKAVIRSYIEVKQARGRTGQQIGWKLLLLERELPQYAQLFIAVRAEKRLPPSSVLSSITPQLSRANTNTGPSLQEQYLLGRTNTNTSTRSHQGPSLQEQYLLGPGNGPASGSNRHPGRTPSSASVRSNRPAVAPASPARTASTYRPAPQAMNPEDSEELPPPPYQSEDPEPEATRDLQLRLAAEAQAAGNLNLPEASASASSSGNTDEQGNGSNTTGGVAGNNTTNTNSNVNSSGGDQPVVVHVPPPGPPPASLQRHQSTRSEHQPSTPPTDPEEARIWEESQLEEAVRLSRISDRERLELEEAMRLSLAESEASGNGNGNGNGQYMPPVFEEQDEHDSSGPSSRRMSSYTPSGQLEASHRRSTSDTYGHGQGQGGMGMGMNSDVKSATSGMDHLTIPDTWQAGSSSGSGSNNYQHQQNLMDDDFGSSEYTQPTLAPQRTGAVMQSNNPFLSPGEREGEFIQPQGQASPSASVQWPQPHRQPSSTELRGSPGRERGLAHVQSQDQMQNHGTSSSPGNKRLPSIPDDQVARQSGAVPESAPSQWLNANPVNTAPTLPPLPPRQPTQPTSNSNSNSNSPDQIRRLPPRPQGSPLPPTLPQRNVSAQMYSATNPPHSSFPDHSPTPTPSFFPPQPQSASKSPPSSAALQRAISTHHGGEDPLEMLRDFHTVFLVDDSSSMAGERWGQARQALMGVAETAAPYDDQGVDVYFLNSKRVGKELRSSADVEDLFAGLEPRGATPTGLRLEAILRDYMSRLERSQVSSPGLEQGHVKPMNLIVVTDGVFAHPVIARLRALAVNPALDRNQLLGIAPVDDPESVLIACAKRLDKGEYPLSQVGIQFLQIGNDSDAREALQELDDGLAEAHGVRDMVDTVPFGEEMSADLIIKALLGGINRRLDRRS